jgi:hypothetical protein
MIDFWEECLRPDPDAALTSPRAVYEAAQRYIAAGLSLIPIADDGSKSPDWNRLPSFWDEDSKKVKRSWKVFQIRPPAPEELDAWLGAPCAFGLAVVAGAVSGGSQGYGLEILDFDSIKFFGPWADLVEKQLPGLVSQLVQIQSPRPGRHVYYRCSEYGGSQKLACVSMLDEAGKQVVDAKNRPKKSTVIESKGEGGYCLVSPVAQLLSSERKTLCTRFR